MGEQFKKTIKVQNLENLIPFEEETSREKEGQTGRKEGRKSEEERRGEEEGGTDHF